VTRLLLSVDFEDWHQLVRRRLGAPDWERSGPALERQTETLLALLEQLGVRATFFVLGVAARSYPALVQAVAARGHEIACHGDQHRPVFAQTPDEFAADVRAARDTIEQLTGVAPAGYRAPAFSITAAARWAYAVLAAEGFAYDSSQHDSPRIRGRAVPASARPHPLELGHADAAAPGAASTAAGAAQTGARAGAPTATLWEFPLAVWRAGGARLPVGGASYWSVLPTALVLRGLRAGEELAGLYVHPHELDPQPLRAGLDGGAHAWLRARARAREAQRNLARMRAPHVLRAIARRHQLITYGEAYAELTGGNAPEPHRAGARP